MTETDFLRQPAIILAVIRQNSGSINITKISRILERHYCNMINQMKMLEKQGLITKEKKGRNRMVVLTDKGAYWLHAFEDWFSIDFISKLWGNSKNIPWPEKVVLITDRKGN